MVKKTLIGLGAVSLATLLIAAVSADSATVAPTPAATTIALVNEDEPASFNGTSYLFGKEFVSLAANDSHYDWQVVSRSVAEKAYADDGVSAVIVLPRSFSHDLLTLEDLDPTTATIDYKVSGDDALTRQRLEGQLFAILRDFNSRIVQMYFASIAGNIAGAQVNVSSIVSRQTALVGSLSSTAYPGVQTIGKGSGQSVSLAALLQAMNSEWVSAQNRFTDGTTKTLTSIGDSLSAEQPNLSEYFSQQEEIARTNVSNGNAAIVDQASSDKSFYDQAFFDHVRRLRAGDGAWTGLDGFSTTAPDGARTGVLASLADAVAAYDQLATDYNTDVDRTVDVLRDQQSELTTSLNDLDALVKRLLWEYFLVDPPAGTVPIDTAGLTVDQARKALARRLANTFSANGEAASAMSTYEKKIRELVATIPTDSSQYSNLFSALQANTGFDPAPYLSRLALIKKYGDAHGIVPPALNVLDVAPGAATQSVVKSVPVTVPAGEGRTVSVILPSTMSPADVEIRVRDAESACARAHPDCVRVDRRSAAVTIDNTDGSEGLTVWLDYAIDLTGVAGTVTIAYTTRDASSAQAPQESLGSDVYVLAPRNAVSASIGGDDFVAITTYLGDIQAAADLLGFLFGAPGESQQAFASAVLAGGDFNGHSTESVFNRYGSIDAVVIEDYLTEADVVSYRKLGQDNIAAIGAQISALQKQRDAVREHIDTLSGLHLSPTYFSGAVDQLEAWYIAALAAVEAAPAAWEADSNAIIQLETLPWRGQEEGEPELYLDDRTGPALYSTLSQLIATSSEVAANVAASAQIIADNTSEFDSLIAGVRQTQGDTQTVLDTMTNTISAGTGDVAAAGEFSQRFATVLANTRANGADPAKIYETFANPITTNDRTPAPLPAVSAGFDYRWALIFIAGSLIGALIAYLILRRKGQAQVTG